MQADPSLPAKRPSGQPSIPIQGDETQIRAQELVLVAQLREGNADAFTALFRTYYATLINFLRRYLEIQSDAEDIAQDTLAVLWERRQTLDPARSVRALLFTTARNRALNQRRRQRRHIEQAMEGGIQDGTKDTPNPTLGITSLAVAADAHLLADELHRVAMAHIATLPPRQHEIFQLSREEGLTPAEIAEVLGITTQTVYVQLGRIAKTLYAALDAWTYPRK